LKKALCVERYKGLPDRPPKGGRLHDPAFNCPLALCIRVGLGRGAINVGRILLLNPAEETDQVALNESLYVERYKGLPDRSTRSGLQLPL
jgi:hypothetical protein